MMLIRSVIAIALVGGAIGLAAAPNPSAIAPAPSAAADVWHLTVDQTHSSLIFKIRHLGISNFIGLFEDVHGYIDYDDLSPENSSFHVWSKVASVQTRNGSRDKHLKSPDFFNVAEFPQMSYKSTSVRKVGAHLLRVSGNLTLLGQTKPLEVEVKVIGCGETKMGYRCGFETTFTLKRTDYGMDTYVADGLLGDEVEVTACLESVRR